MLLWLGCGEVNRSGDTCHRTESLRLQFGEEGTQTCHTKGRIRVFQEVEKKGRNLGKSHCLGLHGDLLSFMSSCYRLAYSVKRTVNLKKKKSLHKTEL